jgi:hypothetical protein
LVAALLCIVGAAAVAGAMYPGARVPLALGAVGVAGFWGATRRLDAFVFLFATFLFVEGFLKNAYPYPLTFFLRDIMLGALYLAWFFQYPARYGFRGRYDGPAAAAVVGFGFYVVVLTVVPFSAEPLLYRLGGARWWLAYLPLFFVGADCLGRRDRFDRLWLVIVVVGVGAAAYGIVQYLVGFDHLFKVSPYFERAVNFSQFYGVDAPQALRRRVFGTFSMPGNFAAALFVAGLGAIAYGTFAARKKTAALFFAGAAVILVALALTGCRTSYIPLIIAAVIFAVAARRRKVLPTVMALVVVAVIAVAYVSQGVYLYRLNLVFDWHYTWDRVYNPWASAAAVAAEHPFGLGIGSSAKVGGIFVEEGWRSGFILVESGFGQALTTFGWPGLILFTALLVVIPARLAAMARGRGRERWRAATVFAFCAATLFPMMVDMVLYHGVWPAAYWLSAGAATAVFGRRGGEPHAGGVRV